MPRLLGHLDHWIFGQFRASAHDLAVARIVLAGYLLVEFLPRGRWIASLPRAFFNPPLSLAALTHDFPSETIVAALNLVAFACAVSLLLGYRTRPCSVLTTLALITLNSAIYATGKIDHNILVVLAPAVMATSGWGDVWSVDATLGRVHQLEPDRPQSRWQLSWLALIIAIAIATAGLVKARTGWLDLSMSSSYGHALSNAVLTERPTWLGGVMLRMPSSWIWELTDWATVGLEVAGLLAVWRARWFRCWLMALAAFHVAVALQMAIVFTSNVIAYCLFVPWASVLAPLRRRVPTLTRNRTAVVAGVMLLLIARAALAWSGEAAPFVATLSLVVRYTIVFGAVPLAAWAWLSYRSTRGDSGVEAESSSHRVGTDPDIGTATVPPRTGSRHT